MTYRLNSTRVIGNKPTDMTTFATTANAWMYSSQECRRCKTTTTRVIVTDTALILCRYMILCLSYGSNQNIVGIAIMTGFAVVRDARVDEAPCRFKRSSGNVAHITILNRR